MLRSLHGGGQRAASVGEYRAAVIAQTASRFNCLVYALIVTRSMSRMNPVTQPVLYTAPPEPFNALDCFSEALPAHCGAPPHTHACVHETPSQTGNAPNHPPSLSRLLRPSRAHSRTDALIFPFSLAADGRSETPESIKETSGVKGGDAEGRAERA